MSGIMSISGGGDSPKKPKVGTFDPKSSEATESIFDKINDQIVYADQKTVDKSLMFESVMMSQDAFITYDKNKDGVLSPEEVKASEEFSNGAFNYMDKKTTKDGKTVYTDTDFASFGLNYYENYNKPK